MSRSLRLSETWFRRGLWAVAVVFAGFLVGLGRHVVADLPRVEATPQLADVMDRATADRLRQDVQQAERAGREAQEALDQARLRRAAADADVRSATGSLENWLATRRATQQAAQDPELVARTAALDRVRQAAREALAGEQLQQQRLLDARQAAGRARQALQALEESAAASLQARQRQQELRVFGWRLAFTLPLLVLAGWLLHRHRQGGWWPFVWGFAFFAGFTFFVELVPYLPSYGGYVRSLVGIAVTVWVGRQAIKALERYLARQRDAERQPDLRRREELDYGTALDRLAKGVCPGCERAVDTASASIDFCPHCGLGLYHACAGCGTRKRTFFRFCQACGTPTAGPVAHGADPGRAAIG